MITRLHITTVTATTATTATTTITMYMTSSLKGELDPPSESPGTLVVGVVSGGTPGVDAGAVEVDAGTVEVDAGTVVVDGTVEENRHTM